MAPRKTRQAQDVEEETLNNEFVIAMGNYFTLKKPIKLLCDKKNGVVGTARFWSNWPPKVLKNLNTGVQFNDFYWKVDEKGTLVAWWMDNGLVFCVSTVHRPGKTIKGSTRNRRLLCKTRATWRKYGGTKVRLKYQSQRWLMITITGWEGWI